MGSRTCFQCDNNIIGWDRRKEGDGEFFLFLLLLGAGESRLKTRAASRNKISTTILYLYLKQRNPRFFLDKERTSWQLVYEALIWMCDRCRSCSCSSWTGSSLVTAILRRNSYSTDSAHDKDHLYRLFFTAVAILCIFTIVTTKRRADQNVTRRARIKENSAANIYLSTSLVH